MASGRSSKPEQRTPKLNGAERRFWQSAFLAAELPVLFGRRGRLISPTGAAHLAAEYADAATTEFRRRFRRS